jgi:hypothetical protein
MPALIVIPIAPGFLAYLADALEERFRQSGSLSDLDEAVRLIREAKTRAGPSHPKYAEILRYLARLLRTQFEQSGLAG